MVMGCTGDDLLSDLDATAPQTSQAEGFQWTRAEDEETHSLFLRNFGVGYSYDAVRGSYCDWKDIRCQVFNRYFIEQLQEATGENLIHQSLTPSSHVTEKFEYSKRDYIANVHMEMEEEVDLGLYHSEKRRRQDFIEDGVQETFYYQLEEKHTLAERYISYASLLALYNKKPDVFTLSFRNAVKHLDETDMDNIAAVDSFINVWGTHVIVEAELGGLLEVDLMNYLWRYIQMQGIL